MPVLSLTAAEITYSPNILLLGVFLASAAYIIWLAVSRLYLSPIAKFPGPKIAAFTFWYELYYDVVKRGTYFKEIAKMHEKYGPIVRINPYELHVKDPNFYDVLYCGASQKREKWPWAAEMFGNGTSVFSTVAADHHRLRRSALNKFFSKAAITKVEPVIQCSVLQLCDRLDEFVRSGNVIDLGLAFTVMAADIITAYCFGESFNLLGDKEFSPGFVKQVAAPSELSHMVKQFKWMLPLLKVLPSRIAGLIHPAAVLLFDIQNQVEKVLAAQSDIASDPSRPVIFYELLNSDLPAEERTPARLKGEGQTLVGAGTLTTGNVLRTIIFHLLDNEKLLARLREELSTNVPDNDSRIPEVRELQQLPFLTACINEALRLAYGVSHRLQLISPNKDIPFQDTIIPAGTPVGMTSIFMHDNPEIFREPRAFNPDRFMVPEEKIRLFKHMVPFSRGTRSCLGMNLAWAELYVTVATVVQRFDFELFETTRKDVDMAHDFFDPSPNVDSKGFRVIVRRRQQNLV